MKIEVNIMDEMKEDVVKKCLLDQLGLEKLNKDEYSLEVKINFMEATD